MLYIIDSLPSASTSEQYKTFADLVAACPQTIPEDICIGISGRIATDGETADNLIFIAETDDEPSNELMHRFDAIAQKIGLHGTVLNGWRNEKNPPYRLYNHGELIWRIENGEAVPTKAPSAISRIKPWIEKEYVLSRLPPTVKTTRTLWLTGGIAKHGKSRNDVDIFVGDEPFTEKIPPAELREIRKEFRVFLKCRVDVGAHDMSGSRPDITDIPLFKIYSQGKRWQPQ